VASRIRTNPEVPAVERLRGFEGPAADEV